MEFRETLLAAQKNQQQKASESVYYKARFDPPKKEEKQKDRLSANIQKFLAKKEEEERQKKLEAQRKRDELLAMRDPKALNKIRKTLKVIKSANKSVLEDAVDRDNTAVTREGPDQPDQDDYGYESQEAAAIYQKMMEKYKKIPDEPKFPVGSTSTKKDLNGTKERVKQALQHEADPVPHKRRRKKDSGEVEQSPPRQLELEKKKDEKPEKPKIRRPAPPPMDFNQLLKLAEQKKSEPVEVVIKKQVSEPEPERLMTKRQKKEYEEEMARRQRRQERIDNEKGKKVQREDKPIEKKIDPGGLGRIPKLSDKNVNSVRHDSPKFSERDKYDKDKSEKAQKDKIKSEKDRVDRDRERERSERERERSEKERERDRAERQRERDRSERERLDREREKDRVDKEKNEKDKINRLKAEKERIEQLRLDKLKAERERIERDIDRLNKDRERLERERLKLDSIKQEKSSKTVDRSKIITKEQRNEQGVKKSIDLKSQNTYRIDKNSNDKRYDSKNMQTKPVPKQHEPQRNGVRDKIPTMKSKTNDDRSPLMNGHSKSEYSKTIPKRSDDKKPAPVAKQSQIAPNKPKISNTFDFDKHVTSLKKPNGSDLRRKPTADDRKGQKRRVVQSDSEYDSEMDDFIDDGEEDMDYSRHIKEIFGYDKSKYRDLDDDDDPMMESSFARQQREEYISKKIGIMEDLEDMRMEAMEKKKSKKKRRISDD